MNEMDNIKWVSGNYFCFNNYHIHVNVLSAHRSNACRQCWQHIFYTPVSSVCALVWTW